MIVQIFACRFDCVLRTNDDLPISSSKVARGAVLHLGNYINVVSPVDSYFDLYWLIGVANILPPPEITISGPITKCLRQR